MAFTFNATPTTDLDSLRIAIGDVTEHDGQAPSRANLTDALLGYFLEEAGSVAGAAAMAFDHLASLWIAHPVFGPGELSTTHVDIYRKFKAAADDWRGRVTGDGGIGGDDTPPSATVRVSAFNYMETLP